MDGKQKKLKETIYDELKEKIIFSEFLPGSVLLESELCKEFNVSRTPVREALLQLEKEGYVIIEPRKSTRVSKISFQEMNEIIETRLLIEPYILRSLKDPLSEEDVAAFQKIKERFNEISLNDASSLKQFLQLDFQFHCALISLSQNHLLIDFCKEILQRSIRQWYLMYVNLEERLSTAKDEHQGIIDYLVENDFNSAAKALEHHIKAFYDLMFFVG